MTNKAPMSREDCGEILKKHAEWVESDRERGKRADLWNANLQQAGLSKANLQEANLRDTNLHGADLTEANLWLANLQRANLDRADLHEANLRRRWVGTLGTGFLRFLWDGGKLGAQGSVGMRDNRATSHATV